MNHAELLKVLNDETPITWEDSSERHGWTVQAALPDENWLTAGFPENNEASDSENNIIQMSITNEDGDLILAVQFPITNVGMFAMYDFVKGISGADIVAY